MAEQPKVAKRKTHTKSRKGCFQCKQRHTKVSRSDAVHGQFGSYPGPEHPLFEVRGFSIQRMMFQLHTNTGQWRSGELKFFKGQFRSERDSLRLILPREPRSSQLQNWKVKSQD